MHLRLPGVSGNHYTTCSLAHGTHKLNLSGFSHVDRTSTMNELFEISEVIRGYGDGDLHRQELPTEYYIDPGFPRVTDR